VFREWDPWEEIERMNRKIHELMSRMSGPGRFWREPVSYEGFPVDVIETVEEVTVRADLPGFEKENISIKATEDTVEILATKKEEKKEQTETMYMSERRMGSMRRFLTLPAQVNPETAKANMKNGVLEIKFKKLKPTKKVKEIKIQ